MSNSVYLSNFYFAGREISLFVTLRTVYQRLCQLLMLRSHANSSLPTRVCQQWDPCLVKDITSIEKIQRRTLRIALAQKPRDMPYEERCKMLNCNSLEHRTEYLSLTECYKIVFGLNGLDFNDYFEPCRSKMTRANHQYKIQTKSARVNCFKYSFFVRIIKPWNNYLTIYFKE